MGIGWIIVVILVLYASRDNGVQEYRDYHLYDNAGKYKYKLIQRVGRIYTVLDQVTGKEFDVKSTDIYNGTYLMEFIEEYGVQAGEQFILI